MEMEDSFSPIYCIRQIIWYTVLGRSRATNSRCILITCDQKLQAREEKNIIRERIMRSALQFIAQKPPNWFREEVLRGMLILAFRIFAFKGEGCLRKKEDE